MQRIKKILAVALCCLVLSFDAGSSYVYATELIPAYTIGKVAWDVVAWGLLSALGIAAGEATGAVDYLTENVWTPLVAHLKEKWGSMCDVFIDKTNNKSYVSKDMMQDAMDWGIDNNIWSTEGSMSGKPNIGENIHHFFNVYDFLDFINGKNIGSVSFNSTLFQDSANNLYKGVDTYDINRPMNWEKNGINLVLAYGNNVANIIFINAFRLPDGCYFNCSESMQSDGKSLVKLKFYKNDGSIFYNAINIPYEPSANGNVSSFQLWDYASGISFTADNWYLNVGETKVKDYTIDSGLTVPKAGEKIDDWLAAQDKVNGGSVGLLGNDVTIPSDVTGTGAAIDSLPLTIPSFADLVINGQISIDDVLSQGLVKANTGAIADTQSAAGAVAGAEDVAVTGENAEANAISVDQAQTALKNLMQQGIDYIAIEIPNNFWNKIPFSIPYDIYLLIHGIFVGSPGGSKKAPRRDPSSGSNMPVGDPSNVGIEIDIPTVPLKYTEEKTEDTPPNFTFTLNIPYTTPSGQTANFNKEFTIETARYNYFAKIIKFSIGLLWLSSVFQWLLAIFSKG